MHTCRIKALRETKYIKAKKNLATLTELTIQAQQLAPSFCLLSLVQQQIQKKEKWSMLNLFLLYWEIFNPLLLFHAWLSIFAFLRIFINLFGVQRFCVVMQSGVSVKDHVAQKGAEKNCAK